MQPARPQTRVPGSFSPLGTPASNTASQQDPLSRPRPRRVKTNSSNESTALSVAKARNQAAQLYHHQQQQQQQQQQQPPPSVTPIYASFTQHPNTSTSCLHYFSRPTPPALSTAVARQVAASNDTPRTGSPLTVPVSGGPKGHSRKHSQTAGLFDSTLPSTSTSNLSHMGVSQPVVPQRELSASQIAAQAAVMQHQSQQQQHARQRSQTVPASGESYDTYSPSVKRGSGGPLSPPVLSLTEASAPRDSGFGNQGYL